MENPQDVRYSTPWSTHGRIAFGCFLFGFVLSRVFRWNWKTYRLPGMDAAMYIVLMETALLLAYSTVVVLFALRIRSAAGSEYAADQPHWGKWTLLLLATLSCASEPLAFFYTLAIRLLR